jgi:hypothetical protein
MEAIILDPKVLADCFHLQSYDAQSIRFEKRLWIFVEKIRDM